MGCAFLLSGEVASNEGRKMWAEELAEARAGRISLRRSRGVSVLLSTKTLARENVERTRRRLKEEEAIARANSCSS